MEELDIDFGDTAQEENKQTSSPGGIDPAMIQELVRTAVREAIIATKQGEQPSQQSEVDKLRAELKSIEDEIARLANDDPNSPRLAELYSKKIKLEHDISVLERVQPIEQALAQKEQLDALRSRIPYTVETVMGKIADDLRMLGDKADVVRQEIKDGLYAKLPLNPMLVTNVDYLVNAAKLYIEQRKRELGMKPVPYDPQQIDEMRKKEVMDKKMREWRDALLEQGLPEEMVKKILEGAMTNA